MEANSSTVMSAYGEAPYVAVPRSLAVSSSATRRLAVKADRRASNSPRCAWTSAEASAAVASGRRRPARAYGLPCCSAHSRNCGRVLSARSAPSTCVVQVGGGESRKSAQKLKGSDEKSRVGRATEGTAGADFGGAGGLTTRARALPTSSPNPS